MSSAHRFRPVAGLVGVLALLVGACSTGTVDDRGDAATARPEANTTVPAAPISHGGDDLDALLDELIAETGLPAIGVTSFTSDRVIEQAVAGVRRTGDPTPVGLDDQFSIGSNAKAMTATLVATFVDDGLLGWDTTVADVYEPWLPDIDPAWTRVTIRQLLNHTSGIDDDTAISLLFDLDLDAPLADQRRAVADTVTDDAPKRRSGVYAYSSVGYTLAAALLEELTGTPWEALVQTRLFDVLGMDSCGFGAPGTPGEIDQPWGHFDEEGGAALDPGDPEADLPQVLAPAGMVHCDMADWVRFLQSQLRGFRGSTDEIVSPESFDALSTTPSGSSYALGWLVQSRPNGVTTLYHHGSNHRFTAEVWLEPESDWGLITVTNLGKTLADPLLAAVDTAMFDRRNS